MKRDGRTLDHATLETIRLMAVERVLEGEVASAVITSYGFNRTTIYKWLTAAAKGVGLQARPAAGRPRRLTPGQEQQVFRWINGKDPRQYGLDFGLWTRSVVADLIARKFGIRLGLTAVGELLAKLNLTPQKPLQRAYQRDPEASSGGGARPIQPLHSKPRRKVARSSSGMSRGFAPMPFTGGPGVSRDRRRSWTVLVSGNQSVPPLR
jgi:transposase